MHTFQLNFFFSAIIFFALASITTAQYQSETWTTENGLPQNSVTSIVQTRDGYIWFGTFGGLVRFDGIKFKIFNTINAPAIKSNRITTLFEDKNGTLWIGTQYGNLISYKDEVFASILEPSNTERALIQPFCVDKKGVIWTVNLKFTPNPEGKPVAERIVLPNEPNPAIGSITEDDSNNIWISTFNGLYQFQNWTTRFFPYENTFPPDKDVANFPGGPPKVRIFIDSKNKFWVFGLNGLARFENGKFIPLIQKQNANFSFVEDINNTYLVKIDNKIYRFADDKVGELLIDQPDKINLFRLMITDREGNLWVGTNGEGLIRFKQQTARTFTKADGLTDSEVSFAFEDKEKNLWIGADNLYKFQNGKFENVSQNFTNNFESAYQTNDGTLWFGTQSQGLVTLKNGKLDDFSKVNDIQGNIVFENSQGSLFFPTKEFLTIIKDNNREKIPFPNSGVQKIMEDREGGIWFGTVTGLSRLKDGVFTNYSTIDGLTNENVRDLFQDKDGVIWIGTYGGGLNRFKDGRFFPITTREGMNEDIISRILVDDKDNFWMLGNRGVSVISRSALNDLAEGKIKTIACASYGVSDGMLSSEGNGGHSPAGWIASDGKHWFPSIKGAIMVDPKISDLPPPVYIEEFFLDGKQIESGSKIEVSPDVKNLEIHYTGLNFTKPEQVKFKYKLEGYDQDWIEVGTRRAAYYTQIPAGSYQFLVTASTTNGVWNNKFASKVVIVLSIPIWKKWWFNLGISVIAIFSIILFYRLRIFQLAKKRQQQQTFSRQLIESQESDRKRIAAELHDNLGQHLIIIKNWAALGLNFIEKDAPVREQLDEISSTALLALNEVREIIYDLRPHQIETIGLSKTITFMLEQVSISSGIKFKTRIDEIDKLFAPDDEVIFYRILQECVSNIIKHSEAKNADVLIIKDKSSINLKISDDGKGFVNDKNNSSNGHFGFGLKGIEERVKMLNGEFEIQTQKNSGTTVLVNFILKNEK
ncbi:MAG TPA: two-component regulator propeller domain-containing protein [Pyrinomonadaceae bacterium]|nr:two-component regulator propeller domain-containing protein [Pyrinomonadaceae bacterium]